MYVHVTVSLNYYYKAIEQPLQRKLFVNPMQNFKRGRKK